MAYDHQFEMNSLKEQARRLRDEAQTVLDEAAVRASSLITRAMWLETQTVHVERLCTKTYKCDNCKDTGMYDACCRPHACPCGQLST